ncbi:MAG: hypothetical protein U5Q44_14970 [Dehalococcoidia bacterium]|nr:hypothetical protein [Dehalococcoidia bacterium]
MRFYDIEADLQRLEEAHLDAAYKKAGDEQARDPGFRLRLGRAPGRSSAWPAREGLDSRGPGYARAPGRRRRSPRAGGRRRRSHRPQAGDRR